ncbi:hypothetical protein [Xanthobacter sp.]|uniref:hypothetical protein n=1 Tax=Xanthobacter sp. TaxID=35809 RepID=UPI0025CD5EBD|nr:hypothetical protein [Xanthobacter sp.]
MQTIYLRFGDRAAALAALAAGLGYGPAIDPEGGETWPSTGFAAGTRFDLVFLGEIRAPTGETVDTPFGPSPVTAPLPGYHVNVLWWGADAPDFGAAVVTPDMPAGVFAD